MFYDYNCFEILDVFRVTRKAGSSSISNSIRFWSTIAFRISGQSTFHFDNKVIHAGENSLVFIPSNAGFSRKSTDEEMIVVHLKFLNDSDLTEAETIYSHNYLSILTHFNNLVNIWTEESPGYQHRASAIMHTILAELKTNSDNTVASYKHYLIKNGAAYIDSHYDSPSISIGQVAKMCNMSEEYFRKLYKEAYGISPHSAIINKRMSKACRLLSSGHFSVSEVAEKTGFPNSKYFSTLFRKNMNMTPMEYKKLYLL